MFFSFKIKGYMIKVKFILKCRKLSIFFNLCIWGTSNIFNTFDFECYFMSTDFECHFMSADFECYFMRVLLSKQKLKFLIWNFRTLLVIPSLNDVCLPIFFIASFITYGRSSLLEEDLGFNLCDCTVTILLDISPR